MKKNAEYKPEYAKTILGSNMSFAANEAFKLLRTNISYMFPDEQSCRIIGITSALRGEGKTTTSINLAYSIAQSDKKVLLIEGDMRLPTISEKTGLAQSPGLSNLLAGIGDSGNVIQKFASNVDVIASGDIPPNPSELLGSKRMTQLMEILCKKYNYIIIDLPPVNAVSDALVVSKFASGVIMVVRQNFEEKAEFAEAIRRLKLVEAKILGCVISCAGNVGGSYSNKYKKYYKKNYYSVKSENGK